MGSVVLFGIAFRVAGDGFAHVSCALVECMEMRSLWVSFTGVSLSRFLLDSSRS